MEGGRVIVIGAGLAGLAAAVALTAAGRRVVLYEAGPSAGGRCRSFHDDRLGCRIDNGNHLLLSGNGSTMAFLETIGSRATLGGPDEAVFPFLDLATMERWTVRPNAGRVPWWVIAPWRRVPGTRLRDYLAAARLRRVPPETTVAAALAGTGSLFHRLLEPLAVAALNTPPQTASAALFAAVVDESLARGGRACVPLMPLEGLSESFVDPAMAWLRRHGATLELGRRVRGLGLEDGRINAVQTAEALLPLGAGDQVVLAVPAGVARSLLPKINAPTLFQTILNVHFRGTADGGAAGFLGLVNGTAEWIFIKREVVSVTMSAANRMMERPAEEIAIAVWEDVRKAVGLPRPMPPWRVVKEKRATFAALPEQERHRPSTRTAWRNLFLAGDWTATGLPATIEGAVRSGHKAAQAALTACP